LSSRGFRLPRMVVTSLVLVLTFLLGMGSAGAVYHPGEPPNIDPGTPVYTGLDDPVPAEPVAFDPTRSMLRDIYDADLASGGTSFWFDRVLARPFLSNADSALFTRGRRCTCTRTRRARSASPPAAPARTAAAATPTGSHPPPAPHGACTPSPCRARP
jgi:hypothetical protein